MQAACLYLLQKEDTYNLVTGGCLIQGSRASLPLRQRNVRKSSVLARQLLMSKQAVNLEGELTLGLDLTGVVHGLHGRDP